MSSQGSSKMEMLCGLCDRNPSKYCCPRCEILYCSLDCYKSEKHSECSENFYRECVNQELAYNQVDDDSKNKMIDILKRTHNENFDDDDDEYNVNIENDSDDDSEIDLQERIKDLNLDDSNAVWNALTADEKNEFEAMLDRDEVGNLIPQWQPWWSHRNVKKLVEEVNEVNAEKELENCPAIQTVPLFSTLTSVRPSPTIMVNIINIIAGYAFVTRYLNGEIDPIEACTYILEVCNNLKKNTNFNDPDEAVESVVQVCLQHEFIHTDNESLNVMKSDIVLILEGPVDGEDKLLYRKAVLSHLLEIFTEAKTEIKKCKLEQNKDKGQFSSKFPQYYNFTGIDVPKVNKAIRKFVYYLAFLNSYPLCL